MDIKHLYRFNAVLQKDGWISPAYVAIDHSGKIISISKEKPANKAVEIVEGYAIPGFQNAHSHAFQYAMAGLAEIHPSGKLADDFWTWRETMYNIALSISPKQLEAIAAMLYSEMLRHGYTHVAEFHYLHHDKSGQGYNQRSEMSERLMSAADKVGINITLVPIFYQKGGFGKEATEGQRRFIHSTAQNYLKLCQEVEQLANQYGQSWAPGIHSLRAVDRESMQEALAPFSGKAIHIHIAEQLKEIADCEAYYGKKPVEWLYNNFKVDENWHLVHATHLTESELTSMAQSKANVVICPTTEGNLGDGLFSFKAFSSLGGNWSIGTDSHISIDPKEELRLLDYGQRLITHQRNTFVNSQTGDSGKSAFNSALLSGRKAMGNHQSNYFELGDNFNACVIDAKYPLIACSSLNKVLSTYIYAGDATSTLGTITKGQWRVKENRHVCDSELVQHFKEAIKELAFR